MKKIIGILGGMGPFATVEFFKKIVEFTPARKDWEHLRIIIDDNPHIPSRSRFLLYDEESPVKGMIESCKKLANYPVDVIAIPCNSACYFIDEIKKELDTPILNIMEITVQELVNSMSTIKKVGVFGGTITYSKKTYKKYLERYNIQYVEHCIDDQKKIEEFIEKIKNGTINDIITNEIVSFIKEFKKRYKVDVIILGCTEFGCIVNSNLNINIIDSSTELAKYIAVNYGGN